MNNIAKIAAFKFTQYGCEQGVEIYFGQGDIFWSCAQGSDLNVFDELLKTFLPFLDLEQITSPIARELEKQLYRVLESCKNQRAALKAFIAFLSDVEIRFCRPANTSDNFAKKVISSIVQSAHRQMVIIGKELSSTQALCANYG